MHVYVYILAVQYRGSKYVLNITQKNKTFTHLLLHFLGSEGALFFISQLTHAHSLKQLNKMHKHLKIKLETTTMDRKIQ